MTIKLKSLRNNVEAERQGDWVPAPSLPGVRFKVKSMESPEYKDAMNLRSRDLQAQFRGSIIPSEVMELETGKVIAKIILIGWDGMDETYTPDLAEEIMTDPGYRQIHDAISYCATIVGRAKMEFIQDGIKN